MIYVFDIIMSAIWRVLPALITFLLTIWSVSNVDWRFITPTSPIFLTAIVFFWRIYARRIMPYWLIFLFGLLFDALVNIPMGLSAAALVLLAMVTDSQRMSLQRQPFVINWVIYSIVSAIYSVVVGFIIAVYHSMDMQLNNFAYIQIIAICTYPAIHHLMIYIYKRIIA